MLQDSSEGAVFWLALLSEQVGTIATPKPGPNATLTAQFKLPKLMCIVILQHDTTIMNNEIIKLLD